MRVAASLLAMRRAADALGLKADFALVDVLSHGRLDFGVGRSYQPHEFVGLGVEMSESREMFNEGIDIVLRAWQEEKITHAGKYWQIPDPVEVLPKPLQQPHPPVYQATISPESFDHYPTAGEKNPVGFQPSGCSSRFTSNSNDPLGTRSLGLSG